MSKTPIRGIGPRLQQARGLAGDLSARELDRLAGNAEGHASLIEGRETGDAYVGTLAPYARVLGITLDWLATAEGDPPTAEQVKTAVATARAGSAPTP